MLTREQVENVCAGYSGPDWWVRRAIPDYRLANAREHWRTPPAGDVIAFADSTVFGSGKEGLAVLETGIVWHSGHTSRSHDSYDWAELASVPIRVCGSLVQIGAGGFSTAGLQLKRDDLAACLRELQQLALDAGAPRHAAYVPEGHAFPAPGQPLAGAEELRANLHAVSHKDLHVAPGIPPKKERNARDAMRIPPDEAVLALLDTTIFGGAKTGLVVGAGGIYWRNLLSGGNENGRMAWDALARTRPMATADNVVLTERDWVEPAVGQLEVLEELLLRLQWWARARMPAEERVAAIHAAGEVEPAPPAPGEGPPRWHLAVAGQQFGPYDAATVGAMAASGQVDAGACYAWAAGMAGWVPLRDVPELAALVPPPVASPPPPPAPARPSVAPAPKPQAAKADEERIDVNTASVDELLVLPGMTLAGAELLVKERGTRGGFTDVDQVGQLLRLRPHEVERMRGRVAFGRIAAPRGRLVDF